MDLSNCFKAYDVRGRIPDELNPEHLDSEGHPFLKRLCDGTRVKL